MTEDSAASDTPARRLAAFAAGFSAAGIDARLRREAVRCLVNNMAGAFAGSRTPAVARILAILHRLLGTGPGTVIGHPGCPLPLPEAAFMNCISSNVQDFDDTHQRTTIHPTAPVAPALLALAEQRRVSGRDLLDALVIGIEVECRIGNAMSPGHYRKGYHITSTCGVFGAAAAVGRVIGLDAARMHDALGIAAGQSAGLVENLAHGAKNVAMGNAARNGFLAAMLAAEGLDGPPDALEGRFGFFPVMGPLTDREALIGGLGESWEILENNYKPYPVGVVLNPVIDACLKLRGPDPSAIAGVLIEGHPLLVERADRPGVGSANDTRLSGQHVAAICFLRGDPRLIDFELEAARDPALAAFRGKVRVVPADGIAVGAARVTLSLADGGERRAVVEHARGSTARPLSDAELDAKFRTQVAVSGAKVDAEALLAALRGLEASDDAAAVLALCRG